MSRDARFYVDNFTSSTQPPQVSLRSADGRLIDVPARKPPRSAASGCALPGGQFDCRSSARSPPRTDRRCTTGCSSPPHFDPAKRYPAIVDVYGGPGVQRVLDNWTGNSFTQILTRAGYVVFQLDNRGSAFRGTAFQAPIHGRLGDVEVADQVQGARWLGSQTLRRSVAHRRVGLELWRLHDAHADVQGAGGVPRRRRRRARDRLDALRHALHRALSRTARRTTPPATRRARSCRTPRICAASSW